MLIVKMMVVFGIHEILLTVKFLYNDLPMNLQMDLQEYFLWLLKIHLANLHWCKTVTFSNHNLPMNIKIDPHWLIPRMKRKLQMSLQLLITMLKTHLHLLISRMKRNLQMSVQLLITILKTCLHQLIPWMKRNGLKALS